jgi:hypothetical protein
MLERRRQLVVPVELARMEAVSTVSEAYAELIRGQGAITGRLEAAARISRQQDALLHGVGLDSIANGVTGKLLGISEKVTRAINEAEKAIKKTGNNNSIDVIETLRKNLGNK